MDLAALAHALLHKDSPAGKLPTMWTLKVLNPSTMQSWRDKRQWYLRAVAQHNHRYGTRFKPLPPCVFVAPKLWDQISLEMLREEHRTREREPANHVMCSHFVLGTGPYEGERSRVTGSQLDMLKAVKWRRL